MNFFEFCSLVFNLNGGMASDVFTSMSRISFGALFTLSYDAAAAAAAEVRRAVDGARLHSDRGVSRLAKEAIAAAVLAVLFDKLGCRWAHGNIRCRWKAAESVCLTEREAIVQAARAAQCLL